MANFGVIQQGKFTSDGNSRIINLRSDLDWMRVYNYTIADADQTTAVAVEFYWQRGFPAGEAWVYKKSNAAAAANLSDIIHSGGFTLVDQQNPDNWLSSAQATTGISNANKPVISTAATNMAIGDVVLLSQTAADKATINAVGLCGIPFQLGAVSSGASFTIANALSQTFDAAGLVAAATGDFRFVEVASPFAPALRYITKVDITTAPLAPVFTTSMDHGYKVGQVVYINVPSPAVNGFAQANGVSATITAVTDWVSGTSDSTFTLDLDTTGWDAFVFPTATAAAAAGQYTPAHVVPAGMDSPQAISSGVDMLSDATTNELIIGMKLAGGATGPGGANNDVMYWVAGKSFSVDNQ